MCRLNQTFYIAVSISENNKNYAYVLKVKSGDNLLSKLAIRNIEIADIQPTKKQAEATVNHWNACYIANGIFMFDSPQF